MNADELRRDRQARLRCLAQDQGLDGVLAFAWRRSTLLWLMGYMPGYATNWAAAWIGHEGPAELGVRFPFDVTRAAQDSGCRVRAVATPTELVPEGATRIGLLGGDFAIDETPPDVLGELARRAIEVVNLRDEVSRWRQVKSPAEIEAHRQGARIAQHALAAVGATAEPGLDDYAIAARVEGVARSRGATRALCLVGIGRGAVVTEARGARVAPDDPVGLEVTLHPPYACVHVCGTQLPADPRVDDERAMRACALARAAILAALRPGVAVADAVRAGDQALDAAGLLEAKEYDFGHGVGVDLPELPRLLLSTREEIQVGMVLAVHVGVRQPDGPTAVLGGPVVIGRERSEEIAPDAVWAPPAFASKTNSDISPETR